MKDTIYTIAVGTMAIVIVGVVGALLVGLFDNRIDEEKIFSIIGPAFNTIVGCFVGLVAGRILSDKPKDPTP